MKGKFIVFEGIDGSGTSTQADLLKKYFLDQNQESHLTSEPSEGPIGNMIRQAFKGRLNLPKGDNPYLKGGDLFDEQMAYLFAADRHDHLYNQVDGVEKLLSTGASVISTRYFFSSYAYHCRSDSDFQLVASLNARFPNPDLVIYLNNPVNISMERMENRAFKDEYENEQKLHLVKKNYEKVFQNYEGKLITVDATNTPTEIHDSIVAAVRSL